MSKDLISIKHLNPREIEEIFILTEKLKNNPGKFNAALRGKTLALIFEKPSNRTYVSFSVGMYQLGGNAIYLGPEQIKLRVRESIEDVAKTLSRYIDAIVLRTFEHENVVEMAKFSDKPIINGLSDFSHPCQALADIFTVKEKFKGLKGLTLAYVGDGNNVCHSLIYACSKMGINMKIATPKGYGPLHSVLDESLKIAKGKKVNIDLCATPEEAVSRSDVIYTDVWVSMGQEKEAKVRRAIFKDFQVNKRLVKLANKGVIVMHCLPAHRGEEITDEVMDSKNSVIFDQAENRLHVQKAILIKLLKRGRKIC